MLSNVEKLVLLLMGCAIIAFHGWKTFSAQQSGKSILDDYDYQINGLHFLFIGPLIAWCGYKLYGGRNVTDLEKTVLLLLGVLAVLYHGYKLLKKYKAGPDGDGN
jgi:NhaP-type Na+/H+ or K+/H+ antiporter